MWVRWSPTNERNWSNKNMLNDIKTDAAQRMQKCIQSFQADLKKLRTGRAHPSLIEGLKVDFYGTDTPLNQVANIAVEDGAHAGGDALGQVTWSAPSRRPSTSPTCT